MGYWINHNINITGNKEHIEALASMLTQRRPKKLNDEGDIEWSEEEFSFYNILPPPEEMLMSGNWWNQVGQDWRYVNWECYDAPAEEFYVSNPQGPPGVSLRSSLTIRLSTKYDWPVRIFHDLIKQNPYLQFNIWSEGEESEGDGAGDGTGTPQQTEVHHLNEDDDPPSETPLQPYGTITQNLGPVNDHTNFYDYILFHLV